MRDFSEQDKRRRVFAIIICLFLGYLYVENVWKPYFLGPITQNPAAQPTVLPKAENKEESFTESPEPSPQAEVSAVNNSSLSQQQPLRENHKYPLDEEIAKAPALTVATKRITAKVSLLGGRITELLLNDYLAEASGSAAKYNLVKHIESAPYPLGAYLGEQSDAKTLYKPLSLSGSASDPGKQLISLTGNEEKAEIVLEGRLPDGKQIRKTLSFYAEGYFVDVSVDVEPGTEDTPLSLEWTKLLGRQEATLLDPYQAQGFVWYDGQRASREIFSKMKSDQEDLGPVRWVSMEDKYFLVSMLSRAEMLPSQGIRSGQLYRSRLISSSKKLSLSLFLGPKSYRMLDELGYNLQLNVNLGKTGFISAPLLWLLHFFYSFFHNYGLAIVCLTILVRMLLYPLNASAFKQARAMQELKPELDRIRDQISDKQQQQLEMMALYKKRGVNPMGGCLPMLIQLPIFIGLYSALMLAVELRHAPYGLWIHDLSAPEKLMVAGVGIPVMVILFVLTMLIQQWTTPSPMEPAQKKMMMVMPLIFGFMFVQFPAGLTLYYLTSNIISIAQQKAMRDFHAAPAKGLYITGAVAAGIFVLAYVISMI